MNRRHFFSALTALAAAAFVPFKLKQSDADVTPPINPYVIDKNMLPSGRHLVLINPEWRDAPYEITFLPRPDDHYSYTYHPLRFRNEESARFYMDRLRLRAGSNKLI